MRKLMGLLAFVTAFAFSGATLAQDKPAAGADKPAATAEAAKPAATPAAKPPEPNKGDTAWMLVSTALVLMMSVPALALFYGGMVRSKNMLSMLMQVFVVFSLVTVLWVIYGYSLAFTEGNAYFGSFDRLFLKGAMDPGKGEFAMAATFSKGVVIPEIVFVVFQATFAAITCCLILGAFAERVKFAAVLAFVVLWFTFAYAPIAHMVWFWMGPDAYTDPKLVDGLNAKAGLLWQWGALDFAGGTVVHINAGVAGLVGAYLVGKRIGYGKESLTPHSLTLTMVGAALLWVGWFGFNAGSALAADGAAGMAMLVTHIGAATGSLAWLICERLRYGKPSVLGICTGMVAGLGTITPASGFVGPLGAIAIGGTAGVICFFATSHMKRVLGVDDSLDVFPVHGVGGILGTLLTGVFVAAALGGVGYPDKVTMGDQLLVQFTGVLAVGAWSGIVTWILLKLTDALAGLRVTGDEETEGLDTVLHNEKGYNL